jgi:hypothetical protein
MSPRTFLGIPVQRITPAQMRHCRDKGLCYNCDEKWSPAHKCKSPIVYLMHGNELLTDELGDDTFVEPLDHVELVVEPIIEEVLKPEISS